MANRRVTWAEIKEILNNMPESILSQKVTIWTESEDEGHLVASIKILEEDHHYDGDEGCMPISQMKELYEDYYENKDEYHLVHTAGTPVLIIPDKTKI